ncbi:MAG: zinc metallopeptidase [Gammaproteobacteria bacterium]|nr:zinc metallopeptidase [Gammaproteobacteria bacterium]MBT8105767.1 zinc metallopeptidase [Gammaproteobacteria bacterium]NNF48998.1 zinc metallopeptidase [Woeseiaceae bacterium]NNK25781.1 zinc metallopeptidase [Woeseiaceae bacterium]NNL63022.1 zinc metallopeptidase [Woeseiaceae bacterium]
MIFFILVIVAIVFGPAIWVNRVIDRYSVPANRYPGTGGELARQLLDRHGLQAVVVEATDQGDHYDPEAKAVRLSEDKFGGKSLTAVTVAAHEVGHALQDHEGYGPLRMRTRLVKATRGIEKVGAGVLMVAPFLALATRVPAIGLITFGAGLLTLGTSALVHFITLPTEFNASFARALPMLDEQDILKAVDKPHARKLLTAAALTYVSASLMSLLNIARWLAILRR